jgi:tetratricopeptide (TPR) repeat protein
MRGTTFICLLLAAAAPVQAQSYRQLSQWCFGDASDAETIQGCDAVIRWARETTRDAAAAFYNRGIAYRNQGKFDRAIEDYDQALRLRPAFADALNDRGLAYRHKGDNERAIADFDEALRARPDFAAALFNRGGAWVSLGKLDRAIADFERVLVLEPGDIDALLARGEARRASGDIAGGDADIMAARQQRK